MALTRTAAVLTAMLRNRADHLVGTFRADAVLYQYLSDSCRALVMKLTSEAEEMYWAKRSDITTTVNQQTSGPPSDMWKLIALRVTIDNTRKRISRADLDDIDSEAVSVGGWTSGQWPRHRLIGSDIYWAPVPRAAHFVSCIYLPTAIFKNSINVPVNDLTASTDYFDGLFGWDTWVVLDAAIKLLSDEKKDTTVLATEAGQRWAEVMAAAQNQATDEPPKVRDRYGDDGGPWPDRMPPGGWY